MAKFITLTDTDGDTQYVNPDHIVHFYRSEGNDFTTVCFSDKNEIDVADAPDVISEKLAQN